MKNGTNHGVSLKMEKSAWRQHYQEHRRTGFAGLLVLPPEGVCGYTQ